MASGSAERHRPLTETFQTALTSDLNALLHIERKREVERERRKEKDTVKSKMCFVEVMKVFSRWWK